MEYACAGHDAPIVLRDGGLSRIDTANISGPPLCTADDYPFLAAKVQLLPGDLLCLFTDGVTEAMNDKEMFGSDRLVANIGELQAADLQAAIKTLRDAVRHFEAGHPSSDDLTLLLMRWNGPSVR